MIIQTQILIPVTSMSTGERTWSEVALQYYAHTRSVSTKHTPSQ